MSRLVYEQMSGCSGQALLTYQINHHRKVSIVSLDCKIEPEFELRQPYTRAQAFHLSCTGCQGCCVHIGPSSLLPAVSAAK
jgi:hypothetical protein